MAGSRRRASWSARTAAGATSSAPACAISRAPPCTTPCWPSWRSPARRPADRSGETVSLHVRREGSRVASHTPRASLRPPRRPDRRHGAAARGGDGRDADGAPAALRARRLPGRRRAVPRRARGARRSPGHRSPRRLVVHRRRRRARPLGHRGVDLRPQRRHRLGQHLGAHHPAHRQPHAPLALHCAPPPPRSHAVPRPSPTDAGPDRRRAPGGGSDVTVRDVVERGLRCFAGRTAVIDGERRATYGDLADRSGRLANVVRAPAVRARSPCGCPTASSTSRPTWRACVRAPRAWRSGIASAPRNATTSSATAAPAC